MQKLQFFTHREFANDLLCIKRCLLRLCEEKKHITKSQVPFYFACVHMGKSNCFTVFCSNYFCLPYTPSSFCFHYGEIFRALHSLEHRNVHTRAYRAHHKRKKKKKRANNNAKLQYKENHVLQIVYNPFLCALARAQNFFFLEQTWNERASERAVKSKTTTTVDRWTGLRLFETTQTSRWPLSVWRSICVSVRVCVCVATVFGLIPLLSFWYNFLL